MFPVNQIGTPMQGGHLAGVIKVHGEQFGLIVGPRSSEIVGAWQDRYESVPQAQSFFDGQANTQAMAEAGIDIAKQVLALNIDGHADWYIPARDELELLYRHFKPTNEANYVWRHGDNPSSVPAGYPYTEDSPTISQHTAFAEGGDESFSPEWYWSSTRYSADFAWVQLFDDGYQDNDDKDFQRRVRPVRRFKLTP